MLYIIAVGGGAGVNAQFSGSQRKDGACQTGRNRPSTLADGSPDMHSEINWLDLNGLGAISALNPRFVPHILMAPKSELMRRALGADCESEALWAVRAFRAIWRFGRMLNKRLSSCLAFWALSVDRRHYSPMLSEIFHRWARCSFNHHRGQFHKARRPFGVMSHLCKALNPPKRLLRSYTLTPSCQNSLSPPSKTPKRLVCTPFRSGDVFKFWAILSCGETSPF